MGELEPALDRSGDFCVDGLELVAANAGFGRDRGEGGLTQRRAEGVWKQSLIVAALVGVQCEIVGGGKRPLAGGAFEESRRLL